MTMEQHVFRKTNCEKKKRKFYYISLYICNQKQKKKKLRVI